MTTSRKDAVRRIGLLTGGGDCPGLNAVIRAVTKDAIGNGIEVVGIEDGFLGLIENRTRPLDADSVSNILHQGGTVLGSSNKANPAKFAVGMNDDGTPKLADMTDLCMKHIQELGLDALIVVGGDGTMTTAAPYCERGVNCIGVPKTIDNDLWGSDLTFGFLTATQTAADAIDRVRTTAASHHRAMVVEVMGRNAGWIALQAGVASGADVILVPEIEFDLDKIAETILHRREHGKKFSVICCSEGAKPVGGKQFVERVDLTSPDPIRLGGVGKMVAGELEKRTGIESRYVVLGHVQRGGTPTAADRVLATRFGHAAMELLRKGERNRLVVMQDYKLTHIGIQEAADKQRLIDPSTDPLVAAARCIGTSFGD